MLEGEDLLIALDSLAKYGGTETEWLVNNGYLTKELEETEKAIKYMDEFIERYKMPLFHATKKHDNWQSALNSIGLKSVITYELIREKLLKEGLTIKGFNAK